jgi:hypothetical protein
MKENHLKSVKIPSNLDVKILSEKIKILLEEKKQERKKNKQEGVTILNNHIDGLIYFVNLITKNNYNQRKFNDNGYRNLNTELLSNIIGKGDDRKRVINIIKVLKDENIIEQTTHRQGKYSRGYRLTDNYNTGVFKEVELSSKIQKNLLKFQKTKNAHYTLNNEEQISNDLAYLEEQFTKNNLTVEYFSAIKFIKKLGLIFLVKAIEISEKKNQDFTVESLLHYFGRMVNILVDLKDKHYNLSISDSNQRFNSNLTSLPKMLRPFLRINDEQIGEVDISSSQPYILSTILNNDFTDSENKGYNIFTIYPDLCEKFNKSIFFNLSKQRGDETNQVLGIFFNDENFNNLNNFTAFDFKNDFYQNIIPEYINNFSENELTDRVQEKGRNYVKSNMMNYLFESNYDVRMKNDVILLLKSIYPSLSSFIEYFHIMYGNTDFSYLLQRTEAYLMLNNVCKNLSEKHPKIPFFTIHDSLITTVSNLTVVEEIMTDTITNITGKTVIVKKKEILESNPEDWVDKKWKKIRIKSQKRYLKMKQSFLHDNINKGIELLLTGDQTQDALIQKFYKNIS